MSHYVTYIYIYPYSVESTWLYTAWKSTEKVNPIHNAEKLGIQLLSVLTSIEKLTLIFTTKISGEYFMTLKAMFDRKTGIIPIIAQNF